MFDETYEIRLPCLGVVDVEIMSLTFMIEFEIEESEDDVEGMNTGNETEDVIIGFVAVGLSDITYVTIENPVFVSVRDLRTT